MAFLKAAISSSVGGSKPAIASSTLDLASEVHSEMPSRAAVKQAPIDWLLMAAGAWTSSFQTPCMKYLN